MQSCTGRILSSLGHPTSRIQNALTLYTHKTMCYRKFLTERLKLSPQWHLNQNAALCCYCHPTFGFCLIWQFSSDDSRLGLVTKRYPKQEPLGTAGVRIFRKDTLSVIVRLSSRVVAVLGWIGQWQDPGSKPVLSSVYSTCRYDAVQIPGRTQRVCLCLL